MTRRGKRAAADVVTFAGNPSSQKGMYRTVSSLSSKTGYSGTHVRKLLRSGRVRGVKVGNTWFATVRAIREHGASTNNGRPS